ncbi:12461_t:CDS:2 [Gigaspora margarita]|uniref:12461_t:CDS:1 n=1 Tax=Gigaspora margarita TaxID=4874 RepID=A0ABN7VWY0_GIGMA|nr:12461_t:CDS:2 [Gigaspora margarita]
MVEKKILIEDKLEDGKISSVEDGIKKDYFLLTKKRIIDNFNDSSTKKKIDNRIRVAEMTLNESELEVLSGENLEEAENKAALLYAECGYLDYGVEDTKEMISLFNKKENFFKNKTDKNKEPVLEETLISKANLNIEDKDKMAVDSSYNNIKVVLQTRLTLWDLLASSRLAKIRHCFSILEKLQLQNGEILTKQEQFSAPKEKKRAQGSSKRNPAFVYFKSQEDLNIATENVAWYYNTRLNWSGSNQKNTLAISKRCRSTEENFNYKGSSKNENHSSYKKNPLDTSFGRVQEKKRKVTESIISRQTSISRSRNSIRKALMSLNSAQYTLNQNKVLDEILKRLQNIKERQGTYVPYRS